MKPRPERGVGQGAFSMPCRRGSVGGFGSTPCFSGTPVMPQQPFSDSEEEYPAPFPMDAATWQSVAKQLALSPQQTRIVELILCGLQDKDIAAELSLTIPTVRTYLSRIFDRTGVSDRLALVLHIFAIVQQ